MPTLRTGPFLIPNYTCGTHPINIVILTLSNLTNHTLLVRAMIKKALTPTDSQVPPVPISPLFPTTDVSLPPYTVSSIAVPLVDTNTTAINTTLPTCPQVLSVIVSGDIRKSGDLVQVSVTGGFSSDGCSLDISEPTMLFRHDDFVEVHNYHPAPFYHPLDPNIVENNS